MTSHVQLDIETLDTRTTAVVLSIGLAIYDPTQVTMENHAAKVFGVEWRLDVASQLIRGRTICPETQAWWVKQSEEAKAAVSYGPVYDVPSILNRLAETLAHNNIQNVWGNGVDFDNAIVNSLADTFKVARPLNYKHNRCYRTLLNMLRHMLPEGYDAFKVGVAHKAMDDAIYQAVGHSYLHRALERVQPL